MAVTLKVLSNGAPLATVEQFHCWKVTADTPKVGEVAGTYTTDTMYSYPHTVGVNFDLGSKSTAFYDDSKKQGSDASYTPTASAEFHGFPEDLDKVLFGDTVTGGALGDNIDAHPEIGLFYVEKDTNGGWRIVEILKTKAYRAAEKVATKEASTSAQSESVNFEPEISACFNLYRRVFKSDDPVFAAKTLAQVITTLEADPSAVFAV